MTAPGYAVVPNDVSQDPSLSDGAVRLYAVLLGWRPERDGSVLATHEQLAVACGHRRQWAVTRVQELAAASRLRWTRGGYRRPNRYELLDVVPRSRPLPRGAGLVESGTGGEETPAHLGAGDVRVAGELHDAVQPAREPHHVVGVLAAHLVRQDGAARRASFDRARSVHDVDSPAPSGGEKGGPR
jgi:hypothetical protein